MSIVQENIRSTFLQNTIRLYLMVAEHRYTFRLTHDSKINTNWLTTSSYFLRRKVSLSVGESPTSDFIHLSLVVAMGRNVAVTTPPSHQIPTTEKPHCGEGRGKAREEESPLPLPHIPLASLFHPLRQRACEWDGDYRWNCITANMEVENCSEDRLLKYRKLRPNCVWFLLHTNLISFPGVCIITLLYFPWWHYCNWDLKSAEWTKLKIYF